MANLRILANNIADTATITSTSTATGYPTTNMQLDKKGIVWRSSSLASTTLTLTWTTNQTVNCVILPFTNLSTAATIRVVCKNSIGTSIFDSGTVTAIPYTITQGSVSNYSYGGGNTARVYTSTTLTTVRSIDITLVDSGGTQGYMEVSRILCGGYWAPTYNVNFGIEVDYVDQSKHSRSQSGNIITDIGSSYKTLKFDLQYIVDSDRDTLIGIMRKYGMKSGIWVSLFPSDADAQKEYIYSIYGKLSNNPTITHPQYTQYVSSITIEEV